MALLWREQVPCNRSVLETEIKEKNPERNKLTSVATWLHNFVLLLSVCVTVTISAPAKVKVSLYKTLNGHNKKQFLP